MYPYPFPFPYPGESSRQEEREQEEKRNQRFFVEDDSLLIIYFLYSSPSEDNSFKVIVSPSLGWGVEIKRNKGQLVNFIIPKINTLNSSYYAPCARDFEWFLNGPRETVSENIHMNIILHDSGTEESARIRLKEQFEINRKRIVNFMYTMGLPKRKKPKKFTVEIVNSYVRANSPFSLKMIREVLEECYLSEFKRKEELERIQKEKKEGERKCKK